MILKTEFYDNSILSGTKIISVLANLPAGFTITQFFQVLKWNIKKRGVKNGFTITQFFQVLKSSRQVIPFEYVLR